MEAFFVLVGLGMALAVLAAPILALVALSRSGRLAQDLEATRRDLAALEARVRAAQAAWRVAAVPQPAAATPPAPTPLPASPAAPVRPPAPVTAPGARTEAPAAPTATPAAQPSPPAAPPSPPAHRPPASAVRREPEAADFATNLGPKLLVAAGGLAVVVFLGFFVRYAWENNWVGPTGRVLSGAVVSLGLVAFGLRLMDREYRPLGQGLTAAGLAGLYVTAFAAHAVYALVPRAAAAAFLLVITGCAVALADRLSARLLATLAWIGGYLAPILLSTGQDRAVALFAYLLLLGAGAVWLDRRQPWPETLPLALAGSALLYAGWYAEFFRPERFGVAAAGLVLLTALFALGSATKERTLSMGLVALLATLGLSVLAVGANRPEVLLPLCLLLAAAMLRLHGGASPGVGLLTPIALGIPFLCWAAAHYRPEAFGIAAAWVAGGALLLALAPAAAGAPEAALPDALLPAVAVLAGGAASIGLANVTDRPMALLALLAAQAGLAVLVSRRWAWAETAGVATGALAVFTWYEQYFKPERANEALALALTVAGLYFLVLTVRLALRQSLGVAGALTHAVAAALAWTVVYRVLSATAPSLLGPAAVALGAIHLAVGLAARASGQDLLRVRVVLALAAGFLTIAIPVQLGLHGITLAWAVEGVALLWLGVRQDSWLARVFGYGVLALAVGRLFARHLPLHAGAFTPVANPAFGVWLAVIASLAVAYAVLRSLAARARPADETAQVLLGPVALALLFALLTMETQSAFKQAALSAFAANDAAAARNASLQGDLAVSVLWTLFATGLLAGGLAARSRGLFYAAYALFAITAGKVVLVDLAALPTLYRMLSFLALGVLLLAGAWLNLRFRERLAGPAEAAS